MSSDNTKGTNNHPTTAMSEIPDIMLQDYHTQVLKHRVPAFMRTDREGRLLDFGGNLDEYDIPAPKAGSLLTEQVFILAGLVPLEGEAIHLPCVRIGHGRPAEVHVFPGTDCDWILFLDATEYDQRWSRIQQRTIDLSLLRDYQEKIDNLKNEFISTVSHELRTPLTSIHGSLGLILGGATGESTEETRKLLTIAHNNTDRLVRLINDILDIEKIESGNMDFVFEPTVAELLMEQAINANKEYGNRYQVVFKLGKPLKDAWVNVDADKIIQVLTNLLSNAAKFSPPNSDVTLKAQRVNGHIRFSVTDHGNGIPKEFQERIFEKFSQASSGSTRKVGGTGLGLSICKAIVEKHDGSIDYKTQEGKGTTFFFDIMEWQQ